MRATLSVIDGNGKRYYGDVELVPSTIASPPEIPTTTEAISGTIEFSLPIRAFVKKYAAGNSGGAAKFTVLLAFLVRGADELEIPAETIRTEWSRLTAHLGAFNRAHATRAKDRAWVDSPGQGTYRLGPLWREAFS